jgi:polysaccharide export outer membrane protein
MQPSESLVINEEGLVPYNIPEYRITKNDILKLDIVTTPKGDAAQFYSSLNSTSGIIAPPGGTNSGNGNGGNTNFYFNGLKVDRNGDVNIMGIGFVKAEGRTLDNVAAEIQKKVNENFVEGKAEVRLNTDGITYYIIGDTESVGISGEKVIHKNNVNIMEVIAMNAGLNKTIERKEVELHRKLPEGIKIVKLDLTRQDIMNSPYYYLQNGDEIYLNTRAKSLNGFGQNPLQTITTGVTLFTTALSLYFILTKI